MSSVVEELEKVQEALRHAKDRGLYFRNYMTPEEREAVVAEELAVIRTFRVMPELIERVRGLERGYQVGTAEHDPIPGACSATFEVTEVDETGAITGMRVTSPGTGIPTTFPIPNPPPGDMSLERCINFLGAHNDGVYRITASKEVDNLVASLLKHIAALKVAPATAARERKA